VDQNIEDRIKYIHNKVDEVNNNFSNINSKLNVRDIASILGIEVILGDLREANAFGEIRYEQDAGGSKKKIILSDVLTDNAQEIVLAHELGHYFLHENEPSFFDKINQERTQKEIEADLFASLLLKRIK
jgi:Zn-dependent peptidase ImmA (M78 family)